MIKIYIATTKEFNPPNDNCYIPMEVGYEMRNLHLFKHYMNDASGEHISYKNASFCELTSLYWMWKNSDADIVGLAHYRRYLSLKKKAKVSKDAIGKEEIENIMKHYDIILPSKVCIYGNVRKQYETGQNIHDYDMVGEIIKEKYPDYKEAFEVISNCDEVYLCNIFIGKKTIADSYCSWLFDILFELEKRIDISHYSKQQKRVFGYLAERLFNVWIYKNKPKVYEAYMFNTEQKYWDKLRRYIHIFEYKVLGIDYLECSRKRRIKREHNERKVN